MAIIKEKSSFIKNLFQGQTAQILIERILMNVGLKVVKTGYENNYSLIIDDIKFDTEDENLKVIKQFPDFFVIDTREKSPKSWFVEVKSTIANDIEKYPKERLQKQSDIKNIIYLILSFKTQNIYVLESKDLEIEGKNINLKKYNTLENYKPFISEEKKESVKEITNLLFNRLEKMIESLEVIQES